jgi:hypothetical protein
MAYRKHDYIPSNTAQFKVFAHRLISYVQEKTFGGADAPWKDAIPRARFDAMLQRFTARNLELTARFLNQVFFMGFFCASISVSYI